ncbi:hypothetical protein CHLNCDRAFT_137012 [Chlorella variabilis]|uniref:Uncharacterized protein n=1 Tax=Chlorella variabilis TaxID=554065 RepID=E1ZLT4_CHLVA|nr:hypothetical protein CHLNCDRAFT_137012 [Chlorella variabilis]EFN53192.1 hypothetical protein CHLNCDRAFT_137012 [Chlorella variabilis]|eukprot:XP_005845294.1 hypothetical protein CHLNCDRAFT_137012 [Chlorella variabilis]
MERPHVAAAACALCPGGGGTSVREALAHKVSRERIGAELEGMIHGPDPVMALRLLHRLRIFAAVFALPPAAVGGLGEAAFGAAATALAAAAYDEMAAWGHPEAAFDRDARRRCLLAAVLLPVADLQVPAAKGKATSAAAHVVREALKWKAKDAEAVDALHAAAPQLAAIYRQLQGQPDGVPAPEELRMRLGRVIRSLKQLWPAGCVTAALLHSSRGMGLDGEAAPLSPGEAAAAAAEPSDGEPDAAGTQRRLDFCEVLLDAATAYGVAGCWQWKPLLDGKQVMAAMGMTAGGPQLGRLLAAAVDWQLAHPAGTADECREWLRREHGGGVGGLG